MKVQSADQERWNQYGVARYRSLEYSPESHIVSDCPFHNLEFCAEFVRLMEPLRGKRILELGCGRGDLAVWMAKQGAQVTAIDIGPDLIAAAQTLSEINQVECEFRQGNITMMPFPGNTYDIVVGVAILHHLSEPDVLTAVRECRRVLKTGGSAIFYEPVENSRIFNWLQQCLPAGKTGSHSYRPSILQRSAWRQYLKSLDDRPMSNREFQLAGEDCFATTRLSPYGCLIRLQRLIGKEHRAKLNALDRFLFKVFPPLRYYSQSVLVQYGK